MVSRDAFSNASKALWIFGAGPVILFAEVFAHHVGRIKQTSSTSFRWVRDILRKTFEYDVGTDVAVAAITELVLHAVLGKDESAVTDCDDAFAEIMMLPLYYPAIQTLVQRVIARRAVQTQ